MPFHGLCFIDFWNVVYLGHCQFVTMSFSKAMHKGCYVAGQRPFVSLTTEIIKVKTEYL